MANRSVAANHMSWHGTLTAGQEEVVTFGRDLNRWELTVESGTTKPVFYTNDHRAAVIPANNTSSPCGVVFPGQSVVEYAVGGDNSQVRLICEEAAKFHVTDASPRG